MITMTRARRRRAPVGRPPVAERMGVEIDSVAINEIDYVHGTTSVVIRYLADPRTPRDSAPANDD